MLIRPADPARDAGACAEIYAPFVRDSAVSFEEQAPDAAEFARRIERTSSGYPWLVAEDPDGIVAGYAYGSAHRERAAYRWAVDVAVYVSASHRRRGVGRALYEELFERLAAQGFHVACAGIALPNDASVALHEALRFQPVGVYRRIGWKAGAWRDVGWWQRELLPTGDGPPAASRPPRA
jgi:L-amino acid N-acyltransferase YncA